MAAKLNFMVQYIPTANISCTHGDMICMVDARSHKSVLKYVLYYSVNIDNWEQHDLVGRRFASAIYQINGTEYTVGNGAIELYPAFGASDDYAAFAGVEISTTIELPGGGSYGFDLPAERIADVVDETWMGLEQILHYVAEVHGTQ